MTYPYSLLNTNFPVYSLLGSSNLGEPQLFDLSGANSELIRLDVKNQSEFQKYVDQGLRNANRQWGIAGYLEKRDTLLAHLPQMVNEERFYHLGVDIILPKDFQLHMPIQGTVIRTGYEEGKGNYGGFVLAKHNINNGIFYSFWGHLNLESLPQNNVELQGGEPLARIGGFEENGDWFYHTHLQIITEKGLKEGFLEKGYCSEKLLPVIDQYCPSPLYLVRYGK